MLSGCCSAWNKLNWGINALPIEVWKHPHCNIRALYTLCNSLLTVEHILISFIDFDIIRQNFYTASNLKDLFHNIHPKCIIFFIRAIGLTNNLNFIWRDIATTCVLAVKSHPSILLKWFICLMLNLLVRFYIVARHQVISVCVWQSEAASGPAVNISHWSAITRPHRCCCCWCPLWWCDDEDVDGCHELYLTVTCHVIQHSDGATSATR